MSVTKSDVENLKKDWLSDPCWDIEFTEGFEAFYEELKEFHENTRAQWDKEKKEEHEIRISQAMTRIGLTDNLCENRKLIEYILRLEDKIGYLEDRLDRRISRLEE